MDNIVSVAYLGNEIVAVNFSPDTALEFEQQGLEIELVEADLIPEFLSARLINFDGV